MLVYQIKLPKAANADAFAAFMRDEYFPAVHKGPTRIGQVTNMQLLRAIGDTGKAGGDFIWQVGWSGLPGGHARIDDAAVQSRFDAFKPKLKALGSYDEVASFDATA